MLFVDHLTKEQIRLFNQMSKSTKKPDKDAPKPQMKRAEKLSQSDLRDLMGMNRDTFKRNRGAIRRK